MTQTDFYRFTRHDPFIPFQVQAADGRTYDVAHPDQILVTTDSVGVLLCRPLPDGRRTERLPMDCIHRIDPLE